jgi:hypothetical protein
MAFTTTPVLRGILAALPKPSFPPLAFPDEVLLGRKQSQDERAAQLAFSKEEEEVRNLTETYGVSSRSSKNPYQGAFGFDPTNPCFFIDDRIENLTLR